METYECILGRRSVRKFKADEIPEKDLEAILESGRWAPSADNLQPWGFVVVKDKEKLKRIADCCPWGGFIAQAPVAIAIVTDPGYDFHKEGGALATQNMALAAWERGIGTCWIGSRDNEGIKKILGIPEDMHLLTVLPFGYPAKEPSKHGRKSLEEIVKR
jgi:nitroreductase